MSGSVPIDKKLDKILEKTVWIWVPFYALFHLIQEVVDRKNNGGGHGGH